MFVSDAFRAVAMKGFVLLNTGKHQNKYYTHLHRRNNDQQSESKRWQILFQYIVSRKSKFTDNIELV